MRRLLLLVPLVATLGACGSDRAEPAPGSPENPLVAQAPAESQREPGSPGQTPAAPGYGALVDRQDRRPGRRFTPCNLVTDGEARRIVGAPMQEPLEAPQGPTCIYRSRSGNAFITLAVQSASLRSLTRAVRARKAVTVGERSAVCGTAGQPTLFLPLTRGRVLTVGAPCAVAARFAVEALPRL